MDGVKLNNQCKLCRLIKQNQDLWIKVHTKIIDEGLSNAIVCKWLNNQIDVLYSKTDELKSKKEDKIFKFNQANFTLHFRKHISDADKMKVNLKKHVLSRSDRGSTAYSDEQTTIADSTVGSNKNDYESLDSMLSLMEDNLVSYSNQMKNNRSKSKIVSIREIGNYSKLVSDFISAKQDIIKLRNSDQQSSMAVQSAIEMIVQGLATKVVSVADEAKENLESELEDQSTLPNQISNLIKSRLSGGLRELVSETSNIIHKNYGIK